MGQQGQGAAPRTKIAKTRISKQASRTRTATGKAVLCQRIRAIAMVSEPSARVLPIEFEPPRSVLGCTTFGRLADRSVPAPGRARRRGGCGIPVGRWPSSDVTQVAIAALEASPREPAWNRPWRCSGPWPTPLAWRSSAAWPRARVVDSTGRLGLAQSEVSKHLACLRECRLVEAARAGGPRSILGRPDRGGRLGTS
jgi:DNA-binding transcriptional ArsR family regulator